MARKAKSAPKKASAPSIPIVSAWLAAGIEEARIADLCGVTPEQAAEVISEACRHIAERAGQQTELQAQCGPAVRSEAEWLRSDVREEAEELRFLLKLILTRGLVQGAAVDAQRDHVSDCIAMVRALWIAGRDKEARKTTTNAALRLGMLRHDPDSVTRAAQAAHGAASADKRRRESVDPDRSSLVQRVAHAKRMHAAGHPRSDIIGALMKKGVSKRQAELDCNAAEIPLARIRKTK